VQDQTKKQIALKVQKAAGDRYATLLFYESFCKFFAWFTLIIGGIFSLFVFSRVMRYGGEEYIPLLIGTGIGCVLSWLSLMVTANMIRAFVDIAVNSFVSVELQKLD